MPVFRLMEGWPEALLGLSLGYCPQQAKGRPAGMGANCLSAFSFLQPGI